MREYFTQPRFRVLLLASALTSAFPVFCGAEETKAKSPQPTLDVAGSTVPTTKIIAIGRWTQKASIDTVKPVMSAEVRETVRLYLDGVIDQWYVRQDHSGVVFILNVTDVERARTLLGRLPLDKVGLMDFELTPLGPIAPLASLINGPGK